MNLIEKRPWRWRCFALVPLALAAACGSNGRASGAATAATGEDHTTASPARGPTASPAGRDASAAPSAGGAGAPRDRNCFPGNTAEPSPLPAQPLGGPCDTSAHCTKGLTCEVAFEPQPVSGSDPRALRACTLDCSRAPCPTGSVCVDAPDEKGKICLPACDEPGDPCALGIRAGRCTSERVCRALPCTHNEVSDEEGIACDRDHVCERAQCASNSVGWCREK